MTSTVKPHRLTLLLLLALTPLDAAAQTATDLAVLRGLAPVTVLRSTSAGKSALAANYTVTGGIQTGVIRQSTLLPFALQQQQALRDAESTFANLEQLADALGTTLGAAYIARAHYLDQTRFTSISPAVANVISYAEVTTSLHSNAGKYFFANETMNGKPVSAEALAILKSTRGETDVFGKTYGFPAGAPNSGTFGNARPFQTEATVLPIVGPDFFNIPSSNTVYNRGPVMDLINSPSYPSGHTTYGYTGALLLALLVPDRYPEMIVRGAEYGNDRIILGAHYAMDVLGGRTLSLYDMAHLLANDPAYLNLTFKNVTPVKDFPAALRAARADLDTTLSAACGEPVAACAHEDTGRFSNPAANEAFYADTQTYNLPVVYPATAATREDVGKLAPEAGYLLTVAFPSLTLEQADQILTETEGPGGGFLDNGSSFGVYSRLNLYAAANRVHSLLPPTPHP